MKFNSRLFAAALLLQFGAVFASFPAVQARDSAEDMHISSPLFHIQDSSPEQETMPSIEPMDGRTVNASGLKAADRQPLKQTNVMRSSLPLPSVRTGDDLRTSWGYGIGENRYNSIILNASNNVWPHGDVVPLHPLLFKSLLACESSFDPSAVSYTGAAGIAQITPETARRFGLTWSTSRDPNYAIPVGVKVLAEKAKVIIDPANYHKMMGVAPEQCPYAQKAAAAYQKYGNPTTEQYWCLMLAAYNGGGGTILRAMAIAYDRGLDPRKWENLVGDRSNPANTPLYLACREIFRGGAAGKYREVADYPVKIMRLYKKSADSEQLAGVR